MITLLFEALGTAFILFGVPALLAIPFVMFINNANKKGGNN